MRIQKEPRIQFRAPLRLLSTSQRPEISASSKASWIVTLPDHAPSGDFHAGRPRGADARQGPAALRDRDRATALSHVIEQRQTLRLELGYVHDSMFHGMVT